jgi:transposase
MKYGEGDGNEKTACIFAAVLPASSMLYTEAFTDMKMGNRIQGHVNAANQRFDEYYGGLPRLLVPDNTRTAVNKASRYEAELNKTYKEMAGHYGCAVVPARPHAPTDKAPVEAAVQIIERRIIAKLRHSLFFSLEELNEAVHVELEGLNDQPFQKQPGSRRSVFESTELHELCSLPSRRYEYAQFKQAKAGFDYHVALDKSHYYSVPYQFSGREVLIRSTSHTVEVFCEGERIACHVRNMDTRKRFITEPSHMPESHHAVADWSPERFISWAAKTGEKTRAYIAWLLERKEHPQQAFRTCAGILRIGATVTPEWMEKACEYAVAHNVYSYACFIKLLENRKVEKPLAHENLRGKDYFKGENHVE